MSHLQKSKRVDIIDIFNYTSPFLNDIAPSINLEANISNKDTSFLDLNKVINNNTIHMSVFDKRDEFGLPIVKIT